MAAAVEISSERMKGKVRWFNATKGTSFVTPDSGSEYLFFHEPSLKSGSSHCLNVGDFIEFEVCADRHGRLRAVDVTAHGGGCTRGRMGGGFPQRGSVQLGHKDGTAATRWSWSYSNLGSIDTTPQRTTTPLHQASMATDQVRPARDLGASVEFVGVADKVFEGMTGRGDRMMQEEGVVFRVLAVSIRDAPDLLGERPLADVVCDEDLRDDHELLGVSLEQFMFRDPVESNEVSYEVFDEISLKDEVAEKSEQVLFTSSVVWDEDLSCELGSFGGLLQQLAMGEEYLGDKTMTFDNMFNTIDVSSLSLELEVADVGLVDDERHIKSEGAEILEQVNHVSEVQLELAAGSFHGHACLFKDMPGEILKELIAKPDFSEKRTPNNGMPLSLDLCFDSADEMFSALPNANKMVVWDESLSDCDTHVGLLQQLAMGAEYFKDEKSKPAPQLLIENTLVHVSGTTLPLFELGVDSVKEMFMVLPVPYGVSHGKFQEMFPWEKSTIQKELSGCMYEEKAVLQTKLYTDEVLTLDCSSALFLEHDVDYKKQVIEKISGHDMAGANHMLTSGHAKIMEEELLGVARHFPSTQVSEDSCTESKLAQRYYSAMFICWLPASPWPKMKQLALNARSEWSLGNLGTRESERQIDMHRTARRQWDSGIQKIILVEDSWDFKHAQLLQKWSRNDEQTGLGCAQPDVAWGQATFWGRGSVTHGPSIWTCATTTAQPMTQSRTDVAIQGGQKHREKGVQKISRETGSSPSSAVFLTEERSGELVGRLARRRRPVPCSRPGVAPRWPRAVTP